MSNLTNPVVSNNTPASTSTPASVIEDGKLIQVARAIKEIVTLPIKTVAYGVEKAAGAVETVGSVVGKIAHATRNVVTYGSIADPDSSTALKLDAVPAGPLITRSRYLQIENSWYKVTYSNPQLLENQGIDTVAIYANICNHTKSIRSSLSSLAIGESLALKIEEQGIRVLPNTKKSDPEKNKEQFLEFKTFKEPVQGALQELYKYLQALPTTDENAQKNGEAAEINVKKDNPSSPQASTTTPPTAQPQSRAIQAPPQTPPQSAQQQPTNRPAQQPVNPLATAQQPAQQLVQQTQPQAAVPQQVSPAPTQAQPQQTRPQTSVNQQPRPTAAVGRSNNVSQREHYNPVFVPPNCRNRGDDCFLAAPLTIIATNPFLAQKFLNALPQNHQLSTLLRGHQNRQLNKNPELNLLNLRTFLKLPNGIGETDVALNALMDTLNNSPLTTNKRICYQYPNETQEQIIKEPYPNIRIPLSEKINPKSRLSLNDLLAGSVVQSQEDLASIEIPEKGKPTRALHQFEAPPKTLFITLGRFGFHGNSSYEIRQDIDVRLEIETPQIVCGNQERATYDLMGFDVHVPGHFYAYTRICGQDSRNQNVDFYWKHDLLPFNHPDHRAPIRISREAFLRAAKQGYHLNYNRRDVTEAIRQDTRFTQEIIDALPEVEDPAAILAQQTQAKANALTKRYRGIGTKNNSRSTTQPSQTSRFRRIPSSQHQHGPSFPSTQLPYAIPEQP